jgi:hypothetical protein
VILGGDCEWQEDGDVDLLWRETCRQRRAGQSRGPKSGDSHKGYGGYVLDFFRTVGWLRCTVHVPAFHQPLL